VHSQQAESAERETTTWARERERASRFMNVRDIIKTHALIEKVSVRESGSCVQARPTRAIPTARALIYLPTL
jgi:hypothetical protein